MSEIILIPFAVLLYGSGLLVWPICLLGSRNWRRARASCVFFFVQLACHLSLLGFMFFSPGILEHGYCWLMLMILANIVFTPLAIGAAIYDSVRSKTHNA